jgi:hypothetical protein
MGFERPRPPVQVRVAGGILLMIGFLTLVATISVGSNGSAQSHAGDYGVALGLVLVGAGLAIGLRWAWRLAVLASTAGLVLGAIGLFDEPDIAYPGALVVSVLFLLLPSLAMFVTLFTPGARRWVRGR